ncbi:MAG: M61 family metallopeptidase [Gammaproteobacteria bacterium]
MPAHVRYQIQPLDPRTHLFEVRCTVPRPAARGQIFRLPSWLRGSYLIRDFARHVVDVRAQTGGGRGVALTRLDKRSLQAAPVKGSLTLIARVFAFDESVRKAFLDLDRGFFNPSSLCYRVEGAEHQPCEVEILAPTDPACRDWRVATTLNPVRCNRAGFGRYRAENYEELIDHPVTLAAFERLDFSVDGIPHALVLTGHEPVDGARITADLARICHVERELFGQQPALDQYLFLTHAVGSGYGGLEHRSSTALICARADLPAPGDTTMSREYRSFLALCAHEYFHLWNVKRIAPARFLESDLGQEAYTRDLWHYEGVTSYYDDLFLLRAGLIGAADYLDILAENATRLSRTPGRHLQSLADSSFEAWTKYYQPDENTPNAVVSYYVKGGLVATGLDLQLRLRSRTCLDDVLRELWARYGRRGQGVPEGGLEAVAQACSGLELQDFFDRYVRGTDELPLAQWLAEFGVDAELRAATGDADNGGRVSGQPGPVSLGLKLRAGEPRVAHVLAGGAAERAGVAPGDLLLALDGWRLGPANLSTRCARLRPGRAVPLHLMRGERLLTLSITPQPPALDTWTLRLLPKPRAAVLKRRQAWLGA